MTLSIIGILHKKKKTQMHKNEVVRNEFFFFFWKREMGVICRKWRNIRIASLAYFHCQLSGYNGLYKNKTSREVWNEGEAYWKKKKIGNKKDADDIKMDEEGRGQGQ